MNDGKSLKADHKFGGGPSVLFDAVAILSAADAIEDLLHNAAVGDFTRDASAHLKFIGYTGLHLTPSKRGQARNVDSRTARMG